MKYFGKNALAIGTAALVATSVAPAIAVVSVERKQSVLTSAGEYDGWSRHRRYRHRDRVDGGDILAGIAILAGVAIVADAASKGKRDRDNDRYPEADADARDYRVDERSGDYSRDDYPDEDVRDDEVGDDDYADGERMDDREERDAEPLPDDDLGKDEADAAADADGADADQAEADQPEAAVAPEDAPATASSEARSNAVGVAVDQCMAAAERNGATIGEISSVARVGDGWEVEGSLQGSEQGGFTCNVAGGEADFVRLRDREI